VDQRHEGLRSVQHEGVDGADHFGFDHHPPDHVTFAYQLAHALQVHLQFGFEIHEQLQRVGVVGEVAGGYQLV